MLPLRKSKIFYAFFKVRGLKGLYNRQLVKYKKLF